MSVGNAFDVDARRKTPFLISFNLKQTFWSTSFWSNPRKISLRGPPTYLSMNEARRPSESSAVFVL